MDRLAELRQQSLLAPSEFSPSPSSAQILPVDEKTMINTAQSQIPFYTRNESVSVSSNNNNSQKNSKNSAALTEALKRYETISKELENIEKNTKILDELRIKNKTAATNKQRTEVSKGLENVMVDTSRSGRNVKNSLTEIQKENEIQKQGEKGSAQSQIRTNMYQTYVRRFQSVMNNYHSVLMSTRREFQDRQKREVRIVNNTLTDDEIDNIVESGQAATIVSQALVSDQLQNVIQEIEKRHLEIKRIEKQVMEILELFQDLCTLVEMQQDSLDVIETRIDNSESYAILGEKELVEAQEYQVKVRQRKCCLLFLLLAIVVAVLGPVLLTHFKN